jgi:hypothetical protein
VTGLFGPVEPEQQRARAREAGQTPPLAQPARNLENGVAWTDRSRPTAAGPENGSQRVIEVPDGDDGIARFPWH